MFELGPGDGVCVYVCTCVCERDCVGERPQLEEGFGVTLYGDKSNYSWTTFQETWVFADREGNSRLKCKPFCFFFLFDSAVALLGGAWEPDRSQYRDSRGAATSRFRQMR